MTSMHAIYYLCIHLSALNIVSETESKEQSIHTLQKKEEKRTNTHKLRHKGERERGGYGMDTHHVCMCTLH